MFGSVQVRGKRILLIESDPRATRSTLSLLRGWGFLVWSFDRTVDLSLILRYSNFDLVISDINTLEREEFDGIQTVRRCFGGLYFVLSAQGDIAGELKAFELGVDDFICKTVDPRILLARICAGLRQRVLAPQPPEPDGKVEIDNLVIDRNDHCALVRGKRMPLSTGEFELLWMLATHRHQALSREFLFINTLGREYDGLDRTIDRRVSRLRKKLDARADLSLTVRTIWGRGYMLAER
ncbi:response regulator transcription factor [Microbulbifer pacificus]|uniref:response regulator transcription factor n=1 Tax=Microbulbifer pacificus TaxID=407164 RepID=UPI00131A1760|nr:response regulator transcription factor [Microbulbifer pacificus]